MCTQYKCNGDDTKGAARPSPICIGKTKKYALRNAGICIVTEFYENCFPRKISLKSGTRAAADLYPKTIVKTAAVRHLEF